MRNISISLICFIFDLGVRAFAQQQQIMPTSPNTAGLQKYIDVPVSNHTGAANFDIPIYVVKEGALSLPISLGYHSGGIKVSELATWVGLGWNLNIGGAITRQVKHLPDEGISAPQQSRGWYRTGYILPDDIQVGFTNQAADITKDGSFGFTLDNVWTGESAANGKFDCEPDLFSFNFNGYAGKFVFDDVYERKMLESDPNKRLDIEPSPHVFPLQDVLIAPNFLKEDRGSVTGKFTYFKITTSDGTKYYFGDYNPDNDPNFVPAVEKTRSHIVGVSAFLSQDTPTFESTDWIISAWYLVRIESADGKRVIKLKYTQERSGYYELGSQFRKLNEAGICGTDFADPIQSSTYLKLSKIAVKSVRLSQVVTANITVNFTANTLREDLNSDQQYNGNYDGNTEAKRLDAIEIQSNLTASCRKFVFDYGYFQENNVGGPESLPAFYQTSSSFETNFGFADKKRLKLLSVQEMSCNGSLQIPKYQFEYHKEYTISNQEITLPRRLSLSRDYWGFFNNKPNQDGLNKSGLFPNVLPVYQSTNPNINCIYAKREPYEQATKVGLLEKITYPTGGYTLIEYEAHRTSTPYSIKTLGSVAPAFIPGRGARDDSDFTIVGGVRVKRVRTLDGSQTVLEKKYEYVGGTLFSVPVYAINMDKVRAYSKLISTEPFSQTCNCLINSGAPFVWKADKTPILTCTPCGGYYVSSESMVPLAITQSNYHIGYQTVNVKQVKTNTQGTVVDDLGITQSVYEMSRYEQYKYQSNLDLYAAFDATDPNNFPNSNDVGCGLQYPVPPPPHFYERGEQTLELVYNKNGVVVQRKEFTRSTDGMSPVTTNKKFVKATMFSVGRCLRQGYASGNGGTQVNVNLFDNLILVGPENNKKEISLPNINITTTLNSGGYIADFTQSVPYFSHYYIYLGRTKVDKVITTAYDLNGGNPITTTAEYKYGNGTNHFLLVESKVQNSSEEYIVTEMRYPKDVTNGQSITVGSDAHSQGIKKLIDAYGISNVIEKITKKVSSVGEGSQRVIASELIQYDPDHLTPAKVYNLEITSPITSGYTKAMVQVVNGNGSFIQDSHYGSFANQRIRYDEDGNVVEIQPRDTKGMTTSYLYGYNNRLPIAEIKNATYDQVSSLLGAATVSTLKTSNLSVAAVESTLAPLQVMPDALTTVFTHDPLIGVLSIVSPNGLRNTYEYDGLGRLLNVKNNKGEIVKSYGYNYQPPIAAPPPTGCTFELYIYRQIIILPATILTDTACKSIELKPGFEAKLGSVYKAIISQ